jgi:hypothetical protein
MATDRDLLRLAGFAALFVGLAGAIMLFAIAGWIAGPLALLMLIGLVGLFFGFGVLIAVYRFVARLE